VQDGLDVVADKQGKITRNMMTVDTEHFWQGEILCRDTKRSIGFHMTVPKESKRGQRTKSLVLYSCSLGIAPTRWDSPGKDM